MFQTLAPEVSGVLQGIRMEDSVLTPTAPKKETRVSEGHGTLTGPGWVGAHHARGHSLSKPINLGGTNMSCHVVSGHSVCVFVCDGPFH